MLLPNERNLTAFGPWQPAATLASAVVALGLTMGWTTGTASAVPQPPDRQASADRCAQGDPVSKFVCRNTWMAGLPHSYR